MNSLASSKSYEAANLHSTRSSQRGINQQFRTDDETSPRGNRRSITQDSKGSRRRLYLPSSISSTVNSDKTCYAYQHVHVFHIRIRRSTVANRNKMASAPILRHKQARVFCRIRFPILLRARTNDRCYESLLFHMSQIEGVLEKRSMLMSTYLGLTLTRGDQYDVRDLNGNPWDVD